MTFDLLFDLHLSAKITLFIFVVGAKHKTSIHLYFIHESDYRLQFQRSF